MWGDRGIPAGMDYRFGLTGYDDAVESWEEYLARILRDEESIQEAQYDLATE